MAEQPPLHPKDKGLSLAVATGRRRLVDAKIGILINGADIHIHNIKRAFCILNKSFLRV